MLLTEFASRVRAVLPNASDEEIFACYKYHSEHANNRYSFGSIARDIRRRRNPSIREQVLSRVYEPEVRFGYCYLSVRQRIREAQMMPIYGYTVTREK